MLGMKMPGRDCRREPGKFRNFAMVDIGAVESGDGDECDFFHEPSDDEGWQRFDDPNEGQSSFRDLTRPQWWDAALSRDEERELIRAAQAGGKNAADKLLRCFHRLALKIAKQYHGPPHNDLVEAAIQGLYEGIQRYKLGRNDCPRLGAYAVHYIREELRKEVWRWRKSGDSSETDVDRWVHNHPKATPEEVVAAVAPTLKRGLSLGKAHNET
jgi:hypothetical protein